jgi:hypothetical protein
MNKREFVAGGLAATMAAPAFSRPHDEPAADGLRQLLTRTRRLPDLAEQAGAGAFKAYVGERFDVVSGAERGERLALAAVERVARCPATDQFNVSFAPAVPGDALSTPDGVRLLQYFTGQRVALHLERGRDGYTRASTCSPDTAISARPVPPHGDAQRDADQVQQPRRPGGVAVEHQRHAQPANTGFVHRLAIAPDGEADDAEKKAAEEPGRTG